VSRTGRSLPPGKTRYPLYRRGWVGPRAGLDRCGKSRPHRDSIPGPYSPERVAVPTELSRPPRLYHSNHISTTKVTASPILNLDATCRWATGFAPLPLLPGEKNPCTHLIGGLFGRYERFREKKNYLALSECEPRTVDCTYSNCTSIIQLSCLVTNVIKRQDCNGIAKKKLISKTIIQL
jgi:hypothetical protein